MQLSTNFKIYILLVLALLLIPKINSQTPQLHAIQGYVFNSDNSQVSTGTNVRINATSSGNIAQTQTSGPPGHSGFFSTTINALSGENLIGIAYNNTHYGKNSVSIFDIITISRMNITLNESRPPEIDINIFSPTNNAIFERFSIFNITFSAKTIYGTEAIGCNATITISNPSVLELNSGSPITPLGNISFNTSINGSFELIAPNSGSSLVTITSICLSDKDSIENLYSETININIASHPAQLHAIQGYVLNTDGTQAGSGSNVTINLTRTGQIYNLLTSGPPGHSGFFSTTILARENDEIKIHAENQTYEGNATAFILPNPSVTKVNVTLTRLKPIDLEITQSDISFSTSSPVENINITMNASVKNIGRADAYNVTISFYNEETFISNVTLNHIPRGSFAVAQTQFAPKIGLNNIFVYVDPPTETNGSIQESNESNNIANNTLHVVAWQEFFGNITLDKRLSTSDNSNISLWFNQTFASGNIFITDSEAQISWSSLQALGRNASNSSTTNDFADADYLLNMSSFSDSVSNRFTSDGITPIATTNFTVHNKEIFNVPVINSINSSNFITGILWDTTKDTDGEFSIEDKEDLIFVTKVNPKMQGAFGTYDYEITIPVKIREYYLEDTKIVYIYYDLI